MRVWRIVAKVTKGLTKAWSGYDIHKYPLCTKNIMLKCTNCTDNGSNIKTDLEPSIDTITSVVN